MVETSFICFRVPAWPRSLGKRLRKAVELHFVDSGLACRLLGIRTSEQLVHRPLRGAIFESWVGSEVYKAQAHRGLDASIYHLREDPGAEIDLMVEAAEDLLLVEAKSGATVVPDALARLDVIAARIAQGTPRNGRPILVYGGDVSGTQGGVEVVSWSAIQDRAWD